MSKRYLVRFTPTDPYFFGGENTFRMGEKSRYYISSLSVPSAATLIGVLRYLLLEQNGLLNRSGKYTAEERAASAALIGAESYAAGKKNVFGRIRSISPLFLTDGTDYYIKTPQNCRADAVKKCYEPMTLSEERYEVESGKAIRVPASKEYRAKDTVSAESYMRLSDRAIRNDLFLRSERVGIAKREFLNGYFKKEYCMLLPGFSFAVTVELEDEVNLHDGIAYMGRERSTFLVSVTESPLSMEDEIKACLQACAKDEFFYLFGDTFALTPFDYTDFAAVDTEVIRMLCTTSEDDGLKLSCRSEFCQILKAGSVTYGDDIHPAYDTEYGFNKLIKVGK